MYRNIAKKWYGFLLILVMIVSSACGGATEEPEEPPKPRASSTEVPIVDCSYEEEDAESEPVQPSETLTATSTVQIEGKAYVNGGGGIIDGREFSNPVQVAIDFTGAVAAEAYRYGQVEMTSAKSDMGEELEPLPADSFFEDEEFITIDRSAVDFLTEEPLHPQDGFRLLVDFFNPTNTPDKITTLTGMVALQTVDPAQIVTIEELDSFLNGEIIKLENRELDQIGSFSLELHDEVIYLVAEGQDVAYLRAQIIDAQERVFLPEDCKSLATEEQDRGDVIKMAFSLKPEALEGARLEITPPKLITVQKLETFLKDETTQIKEPQLDSLGSFSFELMKEVTLLVEGQEVGELEARIIDAQENSFPLHKLGSCTTEKGGCIGMGRWIKPEALEGARLEIIPASSDVITVENLAPFVKKQSASQLDEPQLSSLGSVSLEIKEVIHLVAEGQNVSALKARIIDAERNVFTPDSSSSFTTEKGEGIIKSFDLKPEMLKGARLEIISASSEVITLEKLDTFPKQSTSQLENPKLSPFGTFSLELVDEGIQLTAEGKNVAYIEVRIIDAQAEKVFLPDSETWFSMGGKESRTIGFSQIPPESLIGARLEIILGFETTELPFELTDMTINGTQVASAESEPVQPAEPVVEAETPSTPSTSSSEVQIEGKAYVQQGRKGFSIGGPSYTDPIQVAIDFTGSVAAEAYGYGQVEMTSAKSDTGEELEELPADRFSNNEFVTIDRSAVDSSTNEPEHPKDGFRLLLDFFNPANKPNNITTLTGIMPLQMVDPSQIVTVENIETFVAHSTKKIQNPQLDQFGTFSLELEDDMLYLVAEGQNVWDLEARIIDAEGTPFFLQSTESVGMDRIKMGFGFNSDKLEEARLEIIPPNVITIELEPFLNGSTTQSEESLPDPISSFSVEMEDGLVHVVVGSPKGQLPWDKIWWDETYQIIDAQEEPFLSTSSSVFTTEEEEGISAYFELDSEALRGGVLSIISDSDQVITVDKLDTFLNKPTKIEEPQLDSFGTFSLKATDEGVRVTAEGQNVDDVELRIIDAQEENIFLPIPKFLDSSSMEEEGRRTIDFEIPSELLNGARLEILPFETIQLPFELTDIPIDSQTEEGEGAQSELSILADKLEACEPYVQPFTHPFTGEQVEREIVGLEGALCIYREEMPNNGLMECKYPPDLRAAVADYYRQLANSETTGFDNPLQHSLDNGICVVSGYDF